MRSPPKTSYGAISGKAVPYRPGVSPVTATPAMWPARSASAVSWSDTSIVAPPPRNSAASTPIAAHCPVAKSISETPTRTGGPSGSPVTLMIPVAAWTRGS
jgi:hypothetical protein